MKENPTYPLLVPKSYQSFSPNYRVDGMPSTRADCQVSHLTAGNEILETILIVAAGST